MTTAITRSPRQRLAVFAICLCALLTAASARAAVSGNLDAPSNNATVQQPFVIAGWAVDYPSPVGSGVDEVAYWVYPNWGSGQPAILLGTTRSDNAGTNSFGYRSDIASVFNSPSYGWSGYGLVVRDLPPGLYYLDIAAHSTVSGGWTSFFALVTVQANPHMNVDTPANGTHVAQPFVMGGWAVDLAASTGTGVDVIDVWAYPTDGGNGGQPLLAGVAGEVPGSRPDVGAYFGDARFSDSGWGLTVSGLPAGAYDLHAYAHSVVANGFILEQVVHVLIDSTLSTPSITPSGGNYSAPVSVTIGVPTGAQVFITRDGTIPSASSELYQGTFTISQNTQLRAVAISSGWINSAVAAATFTFTAATPVINPAGGTYTGSVVVTISSPGAQIYYTTDNTDPTTSSTLYTGPIGVGIGVTNYQIRARAFVANWTPSGIAAATYTTRVGTVVQPSASPSAGPLDAGQQVTLSGDPFSNIYYTTDGSNPTQSSTLYLGSITMNSPTTLKAQAYRASYNPSAVGSWTFLVRVGQPTLSAGAGSYDPMPSVTVTTATAGDSLRYTLDRSEPTDTSPLYGGAISVGDYSTLKVAEFRSGWAQSKTVTATYQPIAEPDPIASQGTVALSGVSLTSSNPLGAAVSFGLSGATFDTSVSATVLANDTLVPSFAVQNNGATVAVANSLADGRNTVELAAVDTNGGTIDEERTVWAGARSISVTVRDEQSNPISGVTVTTAIADDPGVLVSAVTNDLGQAVFSNLPTSASLLVSGAADGLRVSPTTVPSGGTSTTLAADVDNDDFHLGFSGWTFSGSDVAIFAHSEASLPPIPCPGCPIRQQGLVASQFGTPASGGGTGGDNLVAANYDLLVDSGQVTTPQAAYRQFVAPPGSTVVRVRYRLQTAELISGRPLNDTFNIRLDDFTAGQSSQNAYTVGTLLAAQQFDANFATPWYTLQLPIVEGHLIGVTLTVQNAIDNAYDSWIYANYVAEDSVQIASFGLRDMIDPSDPYPLSRPDKPIHFLSASTYDSYEGYVRLNGFVKVTGPATDSIQSMTLAIYNGAGTLITRGTLARSSVSNVTSSLIGVPFGATGVEVGLDANGNELPITPLLFEISSTALAALDQNAEDTLLRATLEITTAAGTVRTLQSPALTKLVRYLNTNRFGSRDLTLCDGLSPTASKLFNRPPFPCGRDDWARPKVVQWAGQVDTSVTWNDFSNLNGGFFAAHTAHRHGISVDGLFNGYTNFDAAAAQQLIAFIDANSPSRQIQLVYAGYSVLNCPIGQSPCQPGVPHYSACGYVDNRPSVLATNTFYQAILGVTLADGRPATSVITNFVGHCSHFHVELDVSKLPIAR